jgi:hypothetical protein
MRQTKQEHYPDGFDEKGNPRGPRTMVLHFFVANGKRYRQMTKEEKAYAWDMIEEFKGRLEDIQNELCPNT